MPRIRTIKPEFWDIPQVAAIDWRVVHDGPIPRRVNQVAPHRGDCEYVYLLFDCGDGLVYAGRSFRPADRFSSHRRKPWWVHVAGTVIIRVQECPEWLRAKRSGPMTSRLEAFAIAELKPWANIAAPEWRAMR